MNYKQLEDKATFAAFETIVARGMVSRNELKKWNVDARLDSEKSFFAILFKDRNSHRIECEVPTVVESVQDGGVKLSVEITAIMTGSNKFVPENPWTDVLFNKEQRGTVKLRDRDVLRRKRVA